MSQITGQKPGHILAKENSRREQKILSIQNPSRKILIVLGHTDSQPTKFSVRFTMKQSGEWINQRHQKFHPLYQKPKKIGLTFFLGQKTEPKILSSVSSNFLTLKINSGIQKPTVWVSLENLLGTSIGDLRTLIMEVSKRFIHQFTKVNSGVKGMPVKSKQTSMRMLWQLYEEQTSTMECDL